MKRGGTILIMCFMLLSIISFAQERNEPLVNPEYPESLNLFLYQQKDSLDFSKTVKSHRQFRTLIQQIRKRKARAASDEQFLETLFYFVHNKKLKVYNKYAIMEESLAGGHYGCLTGTALYAILLSAFDYEYDIIELPNHVFLQVKGTDGFYIYESTLPHEGFKKISENIVSSSKLLAADFRKPISQEVVGSWYGAREIIEEPFNIIGLKELAGLQHFNLAVQLYQQKEFEGAIDKATEAYKLYPSKRNQELMQLIVNKILKHDLLKSELRDVYLNQYVSMVKKKRLSQLK